VIIRPYTDRDAAAIPAFLASCHALDPTIVAVSGASWQGFVAMSFNRGAQDFALAAAADGELVGLLMSSRQEEAGEAIRNFRIIVHPRRRRRGVGTRVLAHVVAQDPEGDAILQCSAPDSWLAGNAFLAEHGFRTMNLDLEMCRRGQPPASVRPPREYMLRAYEATVSDDEAWRRLHADGYRGTHGFHPMTPADPETARAAPGFHLWLAEQRGVVCGLCETRSTHDGTAGLLESVVVGSGHRGKGLGRALVVAGVRTLAAQGFDKVDLGVYDDNTRAKALYRSLGFETYAETRTWRRP
jgi:mycothiol synthase